MVTQGENAGEVKAVLLTGTIGSGKTALASELGELLGARGLGTAVVDLDWLGWFHSPSDRPVSVNALIARNLAAVWPSFRDAGATRAILARMILAAAEVEAIRRALPGVDTVVVRVDASPEVIRERLARRDTGLILEGHLAEAVAMTRALDDLAVEDFRIDNGARPVAETAAELAKLLGW